MTSKLILVVDDDRLNLKLATVLLERSGYETIPAASAEEAIDIISKRKPDLVLMDIELPGMDGLTATSKLKADPATAAIPVVALSAYAMARDEQMAKEAGCSGYIVKPYSIKSFLETVSNGLDQQPLER